MEETGLIQIPREAPVALNKMNTKAALESLILWEFPRLIMIGYALLMRRP